MPLLALVFNAVGVIGGWLVGVVLIVLIFLTSILLTLTILMHKGQGGGLSDMFGGGISSSAGSSGVAERNLNRITMGTLLIWLVCIIGYALLVKFSV